MKDEAKTKAQLIEELTELRRRVAELKALEDEQRRLKEELERSEERFKNIFENTRIGIYRTTPDGRILIANPSMVKMLGFSSFEELARRNLDEKGFYVDFPRSIFKQIIECEDEIIGMEAKWVRRDGSIIYVREHARAVRDSKGDVIYYEGTVEDITERKRAEEELRRLATVDTLTDLYNRRTGLTLLEEQLKLAKREGGKLTVCYIDVDGLKEINDAYGHLEGDGVLKILAGLFRGMMREADIACRLGGDEFLLIYPRCALGQAEALWERIAGELEALNSGGERPYLIQLSRGFAEYDPSRETSMDQLIAIADREMYKDKYSRSAKNELDK